MGNGLRVKGNGMRQLKTKIIENKNIASCYYKMRLESPYLARNIKPGQFLEVRCSDNIEPLLRRPLSVHRILKDGVEILYEVVGKGTEALAGRKAGELLDIIGPLGNGFDYKSTVYSLQSTVLIAGGMGVAPLVALAEELVYGRWSMVHSKRKKIYALIGAKAKKEILCKQDFERIGAEVIISTEDSSQGKAGFITDCLTSLLSTIDHGLSTIYGCGPNAMLKEVTRIARAKQIPCQASLEEYMACGVGVCLGCPVKVKKLQAPCLSGRQASSLPVRQAGKLSKLAIDIFIYRIEKYIGAYQTVMGGLDAVIFTAGIGENSPWLVKRIKKDLRNVVSKRVKFLVIPTNEELLIAKDTYSIIRNSV